MKLFLMQHGTSFSKEVDPEQPLSPVGTEGVVRAATAMTRLGIRLDVVLSSTKLRAVQTAEVVCRQLGYPVGAIIQTELLKPLTPPMTTLEMLHEFETRQTMLVVGHLPSLQDLTTTIIGHACPRIDITFVNNGLTCIDVKTLLPPSGTLLYHLPPKLLNSMI